MKIGMVTMYTSQIASFGRKTTEEKARYCALHGYDFIGLSDREGNSERPPAWDKILLLQRYLALYDWLFWTDADSVIMNFSIKLEEFIGENADVIVSRDTNGINTGNWFIRNSPTAHSFLADVYAQSDLINHIWWEQAAVIRILEQRPDVAVLYLPQNAFNSYPSNYVQGDFMLHFAGMANKAEHVTNAITASSKVV